jgi:hypothetical protein
LNYFDQSSGLTGQPQTGVTDSDKGPVLEPIQDISTEDTLAESSKQAGPYKAMEDVADAILIEQSNSQRINVLDTSAGQTQRPIEQANLQSVEVQSLSVVSPPLSFSDSLFFAPGYCSSWPFGRFPITCH